MYEMIDINKVVYSEYLKFNSQEKLDFLFRISFPDEAPTAEEDLQQDLKENKNTVVCIEYPEFFICAGNNKDDLKEFIYHNFVQEGFIFTNMGSEEDEKYFIEANEDLIGDLKYVRLLYIIEDTGIGLSNN